VQVNFHIF